MIRVIDLETTGLEPTDEPVEIGCTDLHPDGVPPASWKASFVKPERKIPPEASAIHHITAEHVVNAKPWTQVWPEYLSNLPIGTTAFASHKASFDGQWITDFRRNNLPLICTWKAALRQWPEAPGHSNQTLRYWLGLNVEDLGIPHRAGPDSYVTAHILFELLKRVPTEQLITWSNEPPLLPTIPIGEHRGKPWREVPKDFLQWMLTKKDMDADLLWNARRELDARDELLRKEMAEKRAAYTDAAKKAAQLAVTVEDLESWFRVECANREAFQIVTGTLEYKDIVATCAAVKANILSASTIQFQGVQA